ncbi:MAG: serine/threonine protein kinase [Thermoanaerobaculia bacterium]
MPPRIGRYEILEKIGSGGFGSVYRAVDSRDGREVAVKTCDIRDPDSRARALREARLSSRLNHPNVVGVIEVVEEEERPYLVQEFLPGSDLNSRMTEGKPLSIDEKLKILTGVAAGLAHAHAEGIIHRDIKPGNVRVLPDGSVKIMDFGIAKLQDGTTDITKTGITMGSASYMCPEQVCGDPVDSRGDIFSWGSLAYELLSGRRAFRSENLFRRLEMVVKEEPDPLSDVAPEVPSRIVEIVEQALRKKPSDRFASAADLRDALEEASRGLGGGEESVTRLGDGRDESTQRVVRTVLIVEDDEALAGGLRQTLEESGYGVETARDGREALDRLAQGDPPAMILLDLMMPRVDGWQFLQEWRSVPDHPRIPIVLLSGVGAIPDAPGVADFLRKPVSPARLLACVERYCR